AEATPDPLSAPGTIDDDARQLIESARTGLGWRKLTIPAGDNQGALEIVFDGQGRFTWDRVLSSGLREQVICDGKSVWHLYPDIGVGSRRVCGRAYLAELYNLVPWVLAPVEDLARGCDVKLVQKNIVALVPRGADTARTDHGRPMPHVRMHLV